MPLLIRASTEIIGQSSARCGITHTEGLIT
ncbi:hypothetical protein ABIB95_000032 [Bradyrhizobium sp. LA2.1]